MTPKHTPTITDPSQNPTIQDLTADRDRLQSSLDRWNTGYIVALALTVIVATAAGLSQFKTILRAKSLVAVQSKIERESDRQLKIELAGRDLEIAKLNTAAGALNKTASEALERAGKAESHLAEANERTAIARREAAEANTKTEGFRLDIATANEHAAEATRKAEEEQLARVKLERAIQPRTLSLAQQQAMANLCSPFSGHTISILSYSGDAEGARLISQISAALAVAKVRVQNRAGALMIVNGVPGSGIWISGIDPGLAGAILKSLSDAGIASAVNPPRPDEKDMTMTVGVKPFELLR